MRAALVLLLALAVVPALAAATPARGPVHAEWRMPRFAWDAAAPLDVGFRVCASGHDVVGEAAVEGGRVEPSAWSMSLGPGECGDVAFRVEPGEGTALVVHGTATRAGEAPIPFHGTHLFPLTYGEAAGRVAGIVLPLAGLVALGGVALFARRSA